MGVNTLNDRAAGQTILDTFFNDIHTALNGDFVGRNSSGVPTSGQNLGTTAFPWGTIRANTLILNGAAVDASQLTRELNVVLSGKTRASSNQPQFILPDGAALQFVVDGTPTSLVLDINGTEVTVSTDITKSSLTAAPSSNNTALVNDADAADQHDTRLWGEAEHRKALTIDNIGSEISALNGKLAAFQIDNGSATEYFLAYVDTSNNRLINCKRGFFYNSSLNPKNRIVFSDNDVITLLKLGWIFVEDNATTVDVSYTNPTWSFESPGSPVTGDYWYDLANKVWKRYDGASFIIINRTLVGVFCNTTTACVGARCTDVFAKYTEENTCSLDISTTEIVKGKKLYQRANVAGQLIQFHYSFPSWNITTDLAASTDMYDATEQASRMYYLYIKDTGETVISDIQPYFRHDLFGRYHPHNPWRCVGMAYNDGSNNLVNANGFTDQDENDIFVYGGGNGYGSSNTFVRRFETALRNKGAAWIYSDSATLGAKFTCFDPGISECLYSEQRAASTMDPGFGLNAPEPGGAAITAPYIVFGYGYITVGASSVIGGSKSFKIGDVLIAGDYNAAGGDTTAAAASVFVSIKKLTYDLK